MIMTCDVLVCKLQEMADLESRAAAHKEALVEAKKAAEVCTFGWSRAVYAGRTNCLSSAHRKVLGNSTKRVACSKPQLCHWHVGIASMLL